MRAPKRRATRPATDLVRGAIFSILEITAQDWSRVLDLFSGSGALGIEALSRGAGWVDFVEKAPKCCAIIKENLKRTGFTAQAKVYCCSVSKALARLNGEYDIVFLDAPYSDPSLLGTLRDLFSSHLIGTGSTVAVQHSSRQPLPPELEQLHLVRDRHYGDTCLSIYKQGGAN